VLVGLGLLAGAVFPVVGMAQVTPRDTVRPRPPVTAPIPLPPDSAAARDTAHAAPDTVVKAPPRDTIKSPLAHAESPGLPEVAGGYRWDREALFASGALSLTELLERIPGATGFTTSWIASPQAVAYVGDPKRVRVFMDGLEIDALDPAEGGVLDLVEVPLWTLEEVRVERGAAELRVYLRTWRYDRTIPNTRTDIYTGDENTNLYRGFFGRRYQHGEALQVGGQQYSTSQPRTGYNSQSSGGRALGLFARVGWAKNGWSADAYLLRENRTRNGELAYVLRQPNYAQLLGAPITDSVRGLRATRTDAYVRAAYGDPDNGIWVQALAATMVNLKPSLPVSLPAFTPPGVVQDPTYIRGTKQIFHSFLTPGRDVSRAQYVIAGGLTKWGTRFSATSRVRTYNGSTFVSPVLRAEANLFDYVSVSGRAERDGGSRVSTVEAGARVSPFSFVEFAAVAERRETPRVNNLRGSATSARAEGALRLGRSWLVGGVIRRDSTTMTVPFVYYDQLAGGPVTPVGSALGTFAGLRGKIYKDVGIDAMATRWTTSAVMRPMAEARGEVYVRTKWLSKFPRGQFDLNATAIYEYRSATPFRTDATISGPTGASVLTQAAGWTIASTLIEVRIKSAAVTWQYRNIVGTNRALVPGYLMPRQTNLYGARWDFFN
jgi:hypothetical protein